MRLWTVHPKYLDAKGLTALWREGLLARAVLHGKTKRYLNHPQLIRFKTHPDPLAAIDMYLAGVLNESRHRGYKYDAQKINETVETKTMQETRGQLEYEWQHLLKKLEKRDHGRWESYNHSTSPEAHPFFELIDGEIKDWEKTNMDNA